jgi:hypothetical protein
MLVLLELRFIESVWSRKRVVLSGVKSLMETGTSLTETGLPAAVTA